jgi:tetratricopeptide (TPR) repeat protein
VLLRELAEVTLSGLKSPDAASEVLESIVEQSPQDPIAMLQLARVYAQRQDWAGLERLGNQVGVDGLDQDLQQLVADSLWQAGRLDQAIVAYDRILTVDPSNAEAVSRKREYLTRTDKHAELLELLGR